MTKLNELDSKIDQVVEQTFNQTQQSFLQDISKIMNNDKAQFTQAQLDLILSLLEGYSKRAALLSIKTTLNILESEYHLS